jgi:hypothetical protein
VSKASRRRQRPGTNPAPSRPTGPPPSPATGPGPSVELPAASGCSGASSGGSGASTGSSGASSSTAAAGAAVTGAAAGTVRPGGSTTRPSTSRPTGSRAGRRERQRVAYQPSFLERYRTALVVVAALVGVALISVFVFFSASQPAFACSTIWTPDPTASPSAGATPALGYVQPDMGHLHVNVGDKVTYTYCAPASGNHINKPGVAGPIPARVYGPSDNVIPQGWIHNLEHGGMVLLYKGDSSGATAEGQAQLRAFYDAFPPGPVCGTPKGAVGPVIARFDQMSTPFQAIVWGRVLQLDTLDQAKILAFWEQWGERTNPEKQCAAPSPSAAASTEPSAAGSIAPSPSPVVTASPAPTSSASAAPSAS